MMALTGGQNETKQAIIDAVAEKLEELNEALIDTLLDEESKQQRRDGYRNIGMAIAEIVEPVCTHIAENTEVEEVPGLIT